MQKARLGVSVGLLGAAIYFMGFFSGYTPALLLAGYVLLVEDNLWLRKTVVKAMALMVLFSMLYTGFNLIPNAINLIDDIATVFDGAFSITVVSRIVTVIVNTIDIIEKVLFIMLGIKALGQGTIAIPVVDKLVDKYMA